MSDVVMSMGQAARRAPRWMLLLLIASLAVNFLFLGLAAGALWKFRGPPQMAGVTPNLLGYASTLPSDRRQALLHQIEAERQHLRPFRREVRVAREETIKALVADPFDRAAFVAAQDKQSAAEQRARQAVRDLYAKIATSLTAEERRAFPGWREHRRPHGQNLLDEPDQPAQAKQ
ncbi:MAG TPA: periplasmic heavy metal sensor [Hyphomicrobiaceae bacterium]|jgi:uncharacterized membrane protein|nr:periplasmic heavy metal sensor [Hyphomicrobiaceae bacterium]